MKAALIGYGRWGKILEPYIKKYFDLIYIAGRDYAIPDKTDVVFVATPINAHYEPVMRSIEKGKHVFVEKPMSNNWYECAYMVDFAKVKNVVLYTNYLEMTVPSRLRMVELFSEIVSIQSIHARTLQLNLLVDIDWQLTCHQLSILSLFTDITKLKFTKQPSVNTISLVMFHGEHSGALFSNISHPKRVKQFIIKGEKTLEYDKDKGVIFNNKVIPFDETDNIDYSIQAFLSAIKDGNSNTEISMEITSIINNFRRNK